MLQNEQSERQQSRAGGGQGTREAGPESSLGMRVGGGGRRLTATRPRGGDTAQPGNLSVRARSSRLVRRMTEAEITF